jgi:molecular chaperone GrpE
MSRKKDDQKTPEDASAHTGEAAAKAEEQGETAGPGSAEANREERNNDKKADEKDIRIAELEKRVKELEDENSELKSQYLRKQADFENFRKRMQREKKDAIQYANSDLLLDLVSIIDDFERAIKSSEESKDFESFHSGIKLIEKQFVGMLERKYGLTRMESEGKEFDPQKHEAINMVESPEHDVQTVVEDYQRGYMLHDRVLRHSRVKVAVPAPETDASETAGQSGENETSDDNASGGDGHADGHANEGVKQASDEKTEE